MTYNPVGVGPINGVVVAVSVKVTPPGSWTTLGVVGQVRTKIVASGNNVSVNRFMVGGTLMHTNVS
jgi:hypothetical protein